MADSDIYPIINAVKGHKLTQSWVKVSQAFDYMNKKAFLQP